MAEFRADKFRDRPSKKFRDNDSPRFSKRFNDGEQFERRESRSGAQLFNVTCDKCGKDAEVPFKPHGGKPVYCSDCFRRQESGESRSSRNSGSDLDQINAKLDKILRALKVE